MILGSWEAVSTEGPDQNIMKWLGLQREEFRINWGFEGIAMPWAQSPQSSPPPHPLPLPRLPSPGSRVDLPNWLTFLHHSPPREICSLPFTPLSCPQALPTHACVFESRFVSTARANDLRSRPDEKAMAPTPKEGRKAEALKHPGLRSEFQPLVAPGPHPKLVPFARLTLSLSFFSPPTPRSLPGCPPHLPHSTLPLSPCPTPTDVKAVFFKLQGV